MPKKIIYRLGNGWYSFKDVPQPGYIKIDGMACGDDEKAMKQAEKICPNFEYEIVDKNTQKKLLGYQPAPAEFPVAGLHSFEIYENLKMGRDCHTEVKSWIPIFEGMIEGFIMIPYLVPLCEPEKEKKEKNKHIEILQHDISYWFDDDSELEEGVGEAEHIEYMIGQGYFEGELRQDATRGYWKIVKK